jgi:hypothetical protein
VLIRLACLFIVRVFGWLVLAHYTSIARSGH